MNRGFCAKYVSKKLLYVPFELDVDALELGACKGVEVEYEIGSLYRGVGSGRVGAGVAGAVEEEAVA